MADFTQLTKLAAVGRDLSNGRHAVDVHDSFNEWVDDVSALLEQLAPGTGIVLEWTGLGASPLVQGGGYHDYPQAWARFEQILQHRLQWLGMVPTKITVAQMSVPERVQLQALAAGRREIKLDTKALAFIDPSRIDQLKKLASATHDFSKLVKLCEELNLCFAGQCYLATSMLTRSLLDHVPPVLGFQSFKEAASNYAGGRSFKASLQNLENSSRKIADQHLHGPIRQSEVLPTAQQVNCSSDLDVLLAEIVRINQRKPDEP